MDSRTFLGLMPSHNPYRWSMEVRPDLGTGGGFLFGGAALGAAIVALEATSGRSCAALRCRQRRGRQPQRAQPTPRGRLLVVYVSWSSRPPPCQELATHRHRVNHSKPSSSTTTPTSSGSADTDGPMNIVTAGSSVWKARQRCRRARGRREHVVIGDTVLACARPMSTKGYHEPCHQPSTCVDDRVSKTGGLQL